MLLTMLLSTAVKDHLAMSEASLLDGTNIACIHALPTGPVALGEHIACSDLSAGAVVFERILRQSQGEGTPYDFTASLRHAIDQAHVPAAFDQARRVLWAFAQAWTTVSQVDGRGVLGSIDAAVALAFSGVMLTHNLHANGVGSRRVTRSRFVEGCRCLDEVSDVPDELSGALYDLVAHTALEALLPSPLATDRMKALDAQPVVKEGWLMVKDLDGMLSTAAPWQRCWTRIYEQEAAFFLTPQQWGLDGEIILSLPMQGLVVTGEFYCPPRCDVPVPPPKNRFITNAHVHESRKYPIHLNMCPKTSQKRTGVCVDKGISRMPQHTKKITTMH